MVFSELSKKQNATNLKEIGYVYAKKQIERTCKIVNNFRMMHACKMCRKKGGGVLSETWKRRILNSHCWRRRRSTKRTTLVVKWRILSISHSFQHYNFCNSFCDHGSQIIRIGEEDNFGSPFFFS